MKTLKSTIGLALVCAFTFVLTAAPEDPKDITVTITKGQFDTLKAAAKLANKTTGETLTAEQYAARLLQIDIAQEAVKVAMVDAEKILAKLAKADTNTVAQVKAALGILDNE